MKLSQIKPNPSNPRTIRDDKFNKLVKSIQQFPAMMEKRPIVVDETMTVLGGNMRLRALQHIYGKSGDIPDNWVTVAQGWTEEQKREFIIKDNAAFGEWDWDALAQDFNADDLTDWGIDIPVPEDATEIPTGDVKDDGFDPEQPVETVCKKGDIWKLGDHRLMCGDSTDSGSVALLMDGVKADIAFSSPPYNAGFGKNITKNNGRSKYTNGDNDDKPQAEYEQFLTKYIKNATENAEYNFVNIQILANNKHAILQCIASHTDTFADVMVWDKQRSQPSLAVNVLNSEFEFVFVFSKRGTRAIGVKKFHGTLKNIVHIPPKKNEFSDEHNAVFPIELASHFINSFSETSVLDLFGGTGTTLIAAEQLNRRCYMMELYPHYCDVIIARWEKFTGRKAEKITDGMDV